VSHPSALRALTNVGARNAEDGSSARRGALCSSFILKTEQDLMSSLMSDHRHQGGQGARWAHGCLDSTMELEPSCIDSAPDCPPLSAQHPPTSASSGGPRKEPLAPEGACLE
jgi:hypothetical protein